MEQTVTILGNGYVRLVDHMGSDLSVVNAARASFERESAELDEDGARLIRFLARNGHTSPFRHATVSYELKAPLMAARQLWKHVVGVSTLEEGSSWNEGSRRYITDEPEFYIPDVEGWRSAPESRKQGSGEPLPLDVGLRLTRLLAETVNDGVQRYERALEEGVAPELARLFLPAYALHVRWRWTCSLHAVAHLLALRLPGDAQHEVREIGRAMRSLTGPLFPVSLPALTGALLEG